MPRPLQYKTGSLIYFQGDPADKVFILQTGKVNLKYQDIETGGDVSDLVQPGEFFGVKSALGRYPREENAMVIQDATVMAFTVPEFEALASANTRIIMKMLKVFSNQLRKVHKQVSSLMAKEEHSPEVGLFSVGEYYLKARNYSQARYIFSRYLTYYPSGRNAVQAAGYLQQAESSASTGKIVKALQEPAPAPVSVPEATRRPDDGDSAKAYNEAMGFVSREKYQQAYLAFKKIMDANEDAGYAAKSAFEIGRCLFLMEKFDECIKYYTMMITRYPKHPHLPDTLFFMGQSYEKIGKKEQAMTFYKKILSMPGGEEGEALEKARQALKALGEA